MSYQAQHITREALMTDNMEIKDVLDIFNGPIYTANHLLHSADALMQTLLEHYFQYDVNHYSAENGNQLGFIAEYERMQALIGAARDRVWEAKRMIASTTELDPAKIAPCTRYGHRSDGKMKIALVDVIMTLTDDELRELAIHISSNYSPEIAVG